MRGRDVIVLVLLSLQFRGILLEKTGNFQYFYFYSQRIRLPGGHDWIIVPTAPLPAGLMSGLDNYFLVYLGRIARMSRICCLGLL